MNIGRETTDIDFLLTRMKGEIKELQGTFEQIVSVYSEDGFRFSFSSIVLLSQPHMDYPGFRVVLNAFFAKRKDIVQIDIGVGDFVEPIKQELQLIHYQGKPFFEEAISLLVYPAETIFSEKLETIISKGTSNSRMKDYHDLILLLRDKQIINRVKLKDAIKNTFSHRGTDLQRITFDEDAQKILQKLWTAHISGLGDVFQDLKLPRELSSVVAEINNYLESVVH